MDVCVYDKLRNMDKVMLSKHVASNCILSLRLCCNLIPTESAENVCLFSLLPIIPSCVMCGFLCKTFLPVQKEILSWETWDTLYQSFYEARRER